MFTSEQRESAERLLKDLHLAAPGLQRLRGIRIPLSAITAVVRTALEGDRFFPPNSQPDDLGDGILIERRGKHYFVLHERFEIGQLRFSRIYRRRYFFLRGASRRYLKYYRTSLRVKGVKIGWWS
jgi:hypothetical protein